jgi:phage terminase large subunit-like protein
MAETPIMSSYYPIFAKPKLSKEGHYRSWRRNRLAFGNGFTVDSVGLDSAKRGSKMMDKRPDLIILDDIDEKGDSPSITQKKIDAIFTSLLPAGSKDLTILAVQNMIIDTGIFSRLSQDDPPFLKNRILSGPYPALQNFNWNYKKDSTGKTLIEVSGEPTWQGFTLDNIQEIVNNIGITAFQSEYQHLIVDESSMFNGIKFQRVPQSQVPELFYKVVSLDPAVTSSDGSDSHGISVMGVSDKGNYYILESWEKRATPELALRKALYFCIKYNVTLLQVESNQGGELWYNLWDNIVSDTGMSNDDRMPGIEIVRASASTGGKMERASQMLIDYELNKVFHVENDSTEDLEIALMRFPTRKPFDLVDSTYWSWQACSNASRWVL